MAVIMVLMGNGNILAAIHHFPTFQASFEIIQLSQPALRSQNPERG
jgi:hypothetical protein